MMYLKARIDIYLRTHVIIINKLEFDTLRVFYALHVTAPTITGPRRRAGLSSSSVLISNPIAYRYIINSNKFIIHI